MLLPEYNDITTSWLSQINKLGHFFTIKNLKDEPTKTKQTSKHSKPRIKVNKQIWKLPRTIYYDGCHGATLKFLNTFVDLH